jgi:hypothetical protein
MTMQSVVGMLIHTDSPGPGVVTEEPDATMDSVWPDVSTIATTLLP